MKQEFEVVYVSNGPNKTTQRTTVVANDKNEAERMIKDQGNRVVGVIFKRTLHGV